ncbi:MAG TPA: glucosaminidase domain-containing protein [Pseudomonadales bacterium]|nr:glucosaminidase domain-containing protein [Pseudomonadales bacterium]
MRLLLALALGPSLAAAEAVPEFAAIDGAAARKQAFISFLIPMIEARNDWILDNRAFLEDLRERLAEAQLPTDGELARLTALATHYGVEMPAGPTADVVDLLLFRGDILPVSMVLAQAANESAWGTSRFAREGNNYFGEWCSVPGCGMVPAQRRQGLTHEVEAFDSVEAAVHSYFRTLNRAVAFRRVRELRAEVRARGAQPQADQLLDGLQGYSAKGQAYIDDLRSIISFNRLQAFDAAPALPSSGAESSP